MEYLVISFDYEGTSSVSLHCLTTVKKTAQHTYSSVIIAHPTRLVELVSIERPFMNFAGFTHFWGSKCAGVTVLQSNNEPKEFLDEEDRALDIV